MSNVVVATGDFHSIPILCQPTGCAESTTSVHGDWGRGLWGGVALASCEDGGQQVILGAQAFGPHPEDRRPTVTKNLTVVYAALAECAQVPPLRELGELQMCSSRGKSCVKE
jgi:hypothetical protein